MRTIFQKQWILTLVFIMVIPFVASSQTDETFDAGAYIIDMSVIPQTINNGLLPYGLVYELVENQGVQVKWIINGTKLKDGVDFTYNGTDFKGGPFIITENFRSTTVDAIISAWEGDGVVGVTTTAPITVPVYTTLKAMPIWTLNTDKGDIAEDFILNANIPGTAYNWYDAQTIDCCNDIFVMPHADPNWSTHSNLFDWNLDCDGAIWLACHAGSASANMFNIATPSQQTNFLNLKTGIATGSGPYVDPGNSLILWGDHSDGTLPYDYNYPTDPFMQFMGIIDGALQNGSEQIFIPVDGGGWNPGAKVYVYDQDHPDATGTTIDLVAASVVAGRGFDDPDRGWVMMESSHDINKSSGPENVAAQRIFFNFSFIAASEKAVIPDISAIPDNMFSGVATSLSFTLPPGEDVNDYTILWSSSCGGTFTPDDTQTVSFTPPTVTSETSCFISVAISDLCGRTFNDTKEVFISCNLDVSGVATSPSCNGFSDGLINLTVVDGQTPYVYDWSLQGGGTGNGTGNIITGLSAGIYDVTLTDDNGTGCSFALTISLSDPPVLSGTATVTNALCNGASTGAIDLLVTGGTPGYSYDWGSGITTEDISNVSAGTYNVTVTDSQLCIFTMPIIIGEPSLITISPTNTDVLCFGESTGAIDLTIGGGTGAMTYLWNDGNTAQNRTGLSAATYTVDVTDSNNCVVSQMIIVGEPVAAISASGVVIDVQCVGVPTGSIDLTVADGTSPYTYLWSNAEITEDITELDAGTYMVTITDDNSCTHIKSFSVGESAPLQLSVAITHATCPSDANGAIDLSVSGGTPIYTYDWDNNGLQNPDTDVEDLTGLVPNIYTVIVTDQNGCTGTISATVEFLNPDPLTPSSINH